MRLHFRVLYAKLYGLERVLSQISVQDAARLLNEFNSRIDLLTKVLQTACNDDFPFSVMGVSGYSRKRSSYCPVLQIPVMIMPFQRVALLKIF